MFPSNDGGRSVLLHGPPEITKAFVFEAAIHWAEEGHRVVYVTPAPLQSIPATYHDRRDLSPGALRLVRLMYLESYESLVDQLVDLHNFQALPSLLLMDDLDAYTSLGESGGARGDRSEIRAGALLALVRDSINACARLVKSPVHLVCACSNEPSAQVRAHFREVWQLSLPPRTGEETNGRRAPRLQRTDRTNEGTTIFDYVYSADGILALERITEKSVKER